MIRAIIIDDEINGLRSLELLIAKFVKDVRVIAASTDPLEGIKLINDLLPDVVFLDIQMPNLNGFEMLEHLEFRDFHLIFTTAHAEYGLKAIKQNAVDYLLKPIDMAYLKYAIERVKQKMNEKAGFPDISQILNELRLAGEFKVRLPSKNVIEYVLPKDILYIEADSHTSKVALSSGSVTMVALPLKDYEEMLCVRNPHFMRIHNSFIVNLNHVVRYIREDGGYVTMSDKRRIPISKHRKDELHAFLGLSPDL